MELIAFQASSDPVSYEEVGVYSHLPGDNPYLLLCLSENAMQPRLYVGPVATSRPIPKTACEYETKDPTLINGCATKHIFTTLLLLSVLFSTLHTLPLSHKHSSPVDGL
jgi:hypothetical protein